MKGVHGIPGPVRSAEEVEILGVVAILEGIYSRLVVNRKLEFNFEAEGSRISSLTRWGGGLSATVASEVFPCRLAPSWFVPALPNSLFPLFRVVEVDCSNHMG